MPGRQRGVASLALLTCFTWLTGCGLFERNGARADATLPASAGAGAGGAQIGAAQSGNVGEPAPAGATAGESPCGVVSLPDVPRVEPEVSANYRWNECGRIGPRQRSLQVLYAVDGSILSLDEDGAVRAYAIGSLTPPSTLVDAAGTPNSLVLSGSGELLLVLSATGARSYRAAAGGMIGADSGKLVPLQTYDVVAEGCDGRAALSPDAHVVIALGTRGACAWDAASGARLAHIVLDEIEASLPAVVGSAAGTQTLTLLRAGRLLRYDFAGQLSLSVDVSALPGVDAYLVDAALSADAATLLLLFTSTSNRQLFALDAGSGEVIWRKDIAEYAYPLATARDGYVLASGAGVYRIADGARVSDDVASFNGARAELGELARKKLVPGEQIAEWDEQRQELVRLYGAHTRSINALDISADGRYLASQGAWGVVWQLADDFSQSLPLYAGSAPDSSWDVGLAPDGDGMVVSGDNVAFYRRGGAFQPSDTPVAAAGDLCLSADWAFSGNGCWVAGTHYGQQVLVRDAHDFRPIAALASKNCNGGVAFSPDGAYLMTASLELFDTATWKLLWSQAPAPSRDHPAGESAVVFSPDGREVVITRPLEGSEPRYASTRYDASSGNALGDVPLSGDRVRYSPEGHWLVSAERVWHEASRTSLKLAAQARVSLFTPRGDIIAGEKNGALVRYCRSSL